ncbi:hypothetical protein ONS95_008196 [Cadophora gregata]|uniref:uncharacterized protein n=1 Tax=Cadophora gregata TaxID=51156 RepID=UPI0026DBD4C4|nr:uncharacterized protein ONS95_008196 [Cadophora gregata]KAK0100232.1 hypothetical protein ONS96_007515 [Cadophora gregata f. sp. sojae]KAK0126608.1 hypothetical protein ONS95_008196 [Cadophora gregata]
MCLFSRRPDWEEDVVFANRRHGRRRRHSRVVSETIITSRPTQQVIHAPPTPPPVIKPAPTPSPPPPPPAPPSPPRIELVSVEEDTRRASPRGSRVSVSTHKKSRHGSRGGGEEVYIERERERVRLSPIEKPREEFETYRYVHGSGHMEAAPVVPVVQEELHRRRSRSITYESNPRASGRVMERERVVIEDDGSGRRREYYRRP